MSNPPKTGNLHCCHAKGCKMPVPPRFLMCPYHWLHVPRKLQRLVWKHYKQGQEVGKDPTPHYVAAATAAINAVAEAEKNMLNKVYTGEKHFASGPKQFA